MRAVSSIVPVRALSTQNMAATCIHTAVFPHPSHPTDNLDK